MIAAPPSVSLVAAPARVVLAGAAARATVAVRNTGRTRVVIEVSRGAYALDLRGRPHLVRTSRSAAALVRVRPVAAALAPGATAQLRVAAAVPRHAEPGDHVSLLLVTSRPVRRGAVAVRMRLGVVVVVRVAGRVVHRLTLVRVGMRRRSLELVLANRGNVTETVRAGCLRVDLRRHGRLVATLRPLLRDLLPRTRGIVELRPLRKLAAGTSVRIAWRGTAPCTGPTKVVRLRR